MNSRASNSTLEPLGFRTRQFDGAALLLLVCGSFLFFFKNLNLTLNIDTKYWISLFVYKHQKGLSLPYNRTGKSRRERWNDLKSEFPASLLASHFLLSLVAFICGALVLQNLCNCNERDSRRQGSQKYLGSGKFSCLQLPACWPPEKQRLLGEVCVCMREGGDSEQLPQGLTVFSLWLSGATAASTMVS